MPEYSGLPYHAAQSLPHSVLVQRRMPQIHNRNVHSTREQTAF